MNNGRKIEKVRLFVSPDLGKNWKCAADCKPGDKFFKVTNERDFQQYWFAVQIYFEGGAIEPPELRPGLKIYTNPLLPNAKVQTAPAPSK
jgi:hypothetical protein